jgi:molecular chaperone GrpE
MTKTHHHKNHHAGKVAREPLDEVLEEVPAQPLAADTTSKEVAALKDQLLRLQADFDNYRKRVLRDQAELAQRAGEALLTDLLPVLDHFELGLKNACDAQTSAGIVDGFRLVYNQLLASLAKAGLEPVNSAEQQPFDPNVHEAVTYQPSATVAEGHILQQLRHGYTLGVKLLRPAQVIVSSGAPAEPPADSE